MSEYRIFKTFSGHEIQYYGLVMLDGCPDYMWKTIDRADTEDEAFRKLSHYQKGPTTRRGDLNEFL